MKRFISTASLAAFAVTGFTASVQAQPIRPYGPAPVPPYGFVSGGNNTGGSRSIVIPRGATGADTYFSSSAVGGNVQRPELAVPNGSAGGGGSGGAR